VLGESSTHQQQFLRISQQPMQSITIQEKQEQQHPNTETMPEHEWQWQNQQSRQQQWNQQQQQQRSFHSQEERPSRLRRLMASGSVSGGSAYSSAASVQPDVLRQEQQRRWQQPHHEEPQQQQQQRKQPSYQPPSTPPTLAPHQAQGGAVSSITAVWDSTFERDRGGGGSSKRRSQNCETFASVSSLRERSADVSVDDRSSHGNGPHQTNFNTLLCQQEQQRDVSGASLRRTISGLLNAGDGKSRQLQPQSSRHHLVHDGGGGGGGGAIKRGISRNDSKNDKDEHGQSANDLASILLDSDLSNLVFPRYVVSHVSIHMSDIMKFVAFLFPRFVDPGINPLINATVVRKKRFVP
jgi:hypothetical protein